MAEAADKDMRCRPALGLLGAFLLGMALLVIGGCFYMPLSTKTTVAFGREISQAQISAIRIGVTTRTELISLLGEPSYERRTPDETLVWAWSTRVTQRGVVGVLTPVPIPIDAPSKELPLQSHYVKVTLDTDGVVRKVETDGLSPPEDKWEFVGAATQHHPATTRLADSRDPAGRG